MVSKSEEEGPEEPSPRPCIQGWDEWSGKSRIKVNGNCEVFPVFPGPCIF